MAQITYEGTLKQEFPMRPITALLIAVLAFAACEKPDPAAHVRKFLVSDPARNDEAFKRSVSEIFASQVG